MAEPEAPKPSMWRRFIDMRHIKIAKWAALAGAILAVGCHFVPKDYRTICDAVAALCGG